MVEVAVAEEGRKSSHRLLLPLLLLLLLVLTKDRCRLLLLVLQLPQPPQLPHHRRKVEAEEEEEGKEEEVVVEVEVAQGKDSRVYPVSWGASAVTVARPVRMIVRTRRGVQTLLHDSYKRISSSIGPPTGSYCLVQESPVKVQSLNR